MAVSAKDLATGKEQRITITATTNLTSEQVEALVSEAEQHADDDKRQFEEAELRNNADSLAYQTERLVNENEDKIDADDKQAAETAIADVRKALEDSDLEGLKSAMAVLQTASQKLGEQMHNEPDAGPEGSDAAGGSESASPSDQDDDVVDAEFEAADEK